MAIPIISTHKNNSGSNRGINLVPQDLKETPRKRTVKKLLSRTSVILFVVYTLALAGLFGFSFFLTGQANQLESTNSALIGDVKKMQDTEELLHTVKNRANLARKIYADNAPSSTQLFDKIIELVPQDLTIIGVETKETSVILSAASKTPIPIQNFLTRLENAKINNVAVQTLTSAFGQYAITIHMQ